MFNPKEALQRIRRTKNEKQQVRNITQGVQPLFTDSVQNQRNTNIEDRISKLQLTVLRLSQQLSNSNDTITKLKKQNSNLQTQVLKLEYENSQLKSNQIYSDLRRNGSNKRIYQTVNEEQQYEKSKQKQVKKIQSHLTSAVQNQKYSLEVQQIIQDIKNEPIQNVLKRKQYQFRARKAQSKQVATGNKYLRDLAILEKEYNKTMKKPVLIIKLDDVDFE